ncbi:HD domain-containing phosphohydrolase [Vallitalea okinawensis]|uniref:HD domain-containing phosphohydrolase n=1 Tax=Vallitalea okinawensis TaxID=2078660 RepID=UPI000CFABF57|nr:HD domain-containing phosphohydrolase [Vallitalea okinawensis]
MKKLRNINILLLVSSIILLAVLGSIFIITQENANLFNTPKMTTVSAKEEKSILILHSYDAVYQWTNQLHSGIIEQIETIEQTSNYKITYYVEYFDTKLHYSDEYFAQLYEELLMKYGDMAIDGIILTDDNAYEFITKNRETLFKDEPIVAIGINNLYTVEEIQPLTTVISDKVDYDRAFKEALMVNEDTKNIKVIVDQTTTGIYLKKELEKTLEPYSETYNVEYLDQYSYSDLQRVLYEATPEDLIFYSVFAQDANGKRFNPTYALRDFSEISSVPIFCFFEYEIEDGGFGGYVVSEMTYGKTAVETLEKYWSGIDLPSIIQDKQLFKFSIYDYSKIKRYHITEASLPESAVLVNKPPSFLDQYGLILLFFSIIMALLLMIIAHLMAVNKRQTVIEEKNSEVIDLSNELMDTQKELIYMLGNVIEVRSLATSDHVKRVAELSYLLAIKAGLPENEAENLKIASALHDIGKIGVPEKILMKPGKLTKEEFETIKTHTKLGNDILKSSKRELFEMARIIAYEHHEKWDGSGYPRKLKGESIHIYARIVAIADVFDALSSKRCYKDAWEREHIMEYFNDQKGKQFDPRLIELFFLNQEEFIEVRKKYSHKEQEVV